LVGFDKAHGNNGLEGFAKSHLTGEWGKEDVGNGRKMGWWKLNANIISQHTLHQFAHEMFANIYHNGVEWQLAYLVGQNSIPIRFVQINQELNALLLIIPQLYFRCELKPCEF
jgi:hypothetical protein